jgi:hypothetical protein
MIKNDDTYYLHGHCAVFALALHKVFGYPICILLINESFPVPVPNDEKGIAHAFCEMDEQAIDASGVKSLSDMLEKYYFHERVNYTEAQMNDHIYQGKKIICKSETDKAIEFIEKSRQKYMIN